jgi:uncharacterized protein
MSPELPVLVQRTLDRLIRAFAPERVVLFGSYAKGTIRPSSDIDLLIIANIVGNLELHQRRARQLTANCFPRVDVVLCTPLAVAEAHKARSPILLSILGSGITVYSRS